MQRELSNYCPGIPDLPVPGGSPTGAEPIFMFALLCTVLQVVGRRRTPSRRTRPRPSFTQPTPPHAAVGSPFLLVTRWIVPRDQTHNTKDITTIAENPATDSRP